MNVNKWLRNLAIGTLMVVPLTLSGCNLFSKEASEQIDPPPADVEMQMLGNEQPVQTVKEDNPNAMTVFLQDTHGYLAPLSLNIPLQKGEDAAVKSLEMMVEDGKYKAMVPSGFTTVLPKGTEIKKLTRKKDQKLAIVEFSQQFSDYNVQDERKMLEAITWTLTSYPNIDKVQVWLDGQKLNEMPVDGMPLDEPLTREMGINLEKADGVIYQNSMPVTVYFSAVTPDQVQYYVPVTRLVQPSADLAKTSLEQLILGPLNTNSLVQVMTNETKVKSIQRTKDTITVDLVDSIFSAGEKTPSEMLKSVILTLTENTSAKKVQIKINGKSEIIGTDDQNYGKPVTRPSHINTIKS